jgi:transglutaminase-like putative cysteine protease
MRYVSPEGRLVSPEAAFDDSPQAMLWDRIRESVGGGRGWSAVIVLLLTLTVARSTATVNWVVGIDIITWVALGGAILMGVLAFLPVREPISLAIALVLAPFVSFAAAWPQVHLRHPTDVIGPQLINTWWERINSGDASSDTSFYLILICLLMWVTGAWLAWCVLRWRKPMLGLIPGAAAFATNVLNVPDDQNGYTLAMLVLTLALLLWTNYTGSIASAMRASVKLTGDARWDFWESGLVAMAALIVLGIMLPPLSTSDRTLQVESGVFTSWAQLQQRLNHFGSFNNGKATGVTGFTDDVRLTGNLQRTRDIVFTYTTTEYGGIKYFRGVNATVTYNKSWSFPGGSITDGASQSVPKNGPFLYAENYDKLAIGAVFIRMLRPPIHDTDVLFYPGQLDKVDRAAKGTQVSNEIGQSAFLYTMDRLSSVSPTTSSGNYVATAEYSTATVQDLDGAGTRYPVWLAPYESLPTDTYRSPEVLAKIKKLAEDVVTGAHATTPYQKASAIEAYLRDPSKFTYSLQAPTPRGEDPIDYFLFTSHTGYCEFFATAMGDMLRSLGIPTRLVNGFGPGTYDNGTKQYIVRGEDAHTWVEVYFPQYGWIPFEPTADNLSTYHTISRGTTGGPVCLRDEGCQTPTGGDTTPGGKPTLPPGITRGEQENGGATIAGIRVSSVNATTIMRIVGGLVAILLLLLVAASRYLRPRNVMGVWKRTLTLASLAGAERRVGETPLELGRRLRRTFPETAEPLGTLTNGFVVAAYAPPEMASTTRGSVMEAWTSLRPMLLRRVLKRLRPSRP